MDVIREFTGFNKFIRALDEDLANLRKALGELLRKLEEVRVRAESEKALRNAFAKLGTSAVTQPQNNIINLKTVRIVINPTAEQELLSLEQAAEALNNKIMQLQVIRKELEVFANVDAEVKIVAVYFDDLPKVIHVKMS